MPAAESLPLAAAKRLQVTVAEVGAAPTPRIAELRRNAAAATSMRVTWWESASRAADRSLERGNPAERAAAARPGRAARLELARSDDGHRPPGTARRRGGRGGAARPDPRAVPDLPQHHRQRAAADARADRRADPARGARGADRDAGARLDVPQEWNIAGRLDRRPGRRARRRLRRLEPARARLQRPRARAAAARRAEGAPVHAAGAPGPDPVPQLLLQPELGLLPAAPRARVAARGRVRGLHRLDARGRLADLRRGVRAGRDRGRGARLRLRLPPVAGERQPLGPRADDAARACSWRAQACATRTASSSAPATIGPIAWLARNEERLARVKHGLVCLLRRRLRAR